MIPLPPLQNLCHFSPRPVAISGSCGRIGVTPVLGGPPGAAPGARLEGGVSTMTHWQIALACATGALALLGGVHTAFAARGRGPILSNTYL